MTEIRFNPLTYARKLEGAGINEKAADLIAQELTSLIDNDLATKNDLKNLKNELIIKLGLITVACSGIIISVLGFLNRNP